MNIRSYPKVEAFGSRNVREVLHDYVFVQEKLDGSQFRFIKHEDGVVRFFSRGGQKTLETADALFRPSMEAVLAVAEKLVTEVMYVGEALAKPKHNILAYEKTPEGHVVLFDIWSFPAEGYWTPSEVQTEAARLGFLPVPILAEGPEFSHDDLMKLVSGSSVLGGCPREGIVIKNYAREQFAKIVAAEFQEVSGRKLRKPKAEGDSYALQLSRKYAPEARMLKAVQRLRDEGKLLEDPKDIGPLIKSVQQDVLDECREEIMNELFEKEWGKICKEIAPRTAWWYKERLSKIGGASEGFVRNYDGTVTTEEEVLKNENS